LYTSIQSGILGVEWRRPLRTPALAFFALKRRRAMSRTTGFGTRVIALATAVLLVFAAEGSAQRGGGGGGGRGGGGMGGGFGGRGGEGFGRGGYGGYGFGGYGGYGWGYGGIGLGDYYGGYPDYGGYYGGYDAGYYSPLYGTIPYYYTPPPNSYVPAASYPYNLPTTGYQSYYPPDVNNLSRVNNNTAAIEVQVPPNAQLWFDGKQTSQRGSNRYFVSPALEPGRTFTYEVRATWIDPSGQVVNQTRNVQVQANKSSLVVFAD
jgi:uncharacterized protein (TIGR03000 family)